MTVVPGQQLHNRPKERQVQTKAGGRELQRESSEKTMSPQLPDTSERSFTAVTETEDESVTGTLKKVK